MTNRFCGVIACMCVAAVSTSVLALQSQGPDDRAVEKQPAAEIATVSGFALSLKVPEIEGNLRASRALVLLSKGGEKKREPRSSLQDWFSPPQILGADWKAGSAMMTVDAAWTGYPASFAELEAGEYWVQGVVRRNQDGSEPGGNTGDVYSAPVHVKFDPKAKSVLTLEAATIVTEAPMRLNERTREFSIRSNVLSEFYGREVVQKAGIRLPRNFDKNADRKYPVVVFIGGFGSTHRALGGMARVFPTEFLDNVIFVLPDPSTMYGHSVFADSANNGPRQKALVQELLPAIEKEFHAKGGGEHRYVTGMSSGGWSSLWLQVTTPEEFAGCWSFCPDPVDFRDFQQIDLHARNANMYTDDAGSRRPLARMNDVPSLWYDNFVHMEAAIGPSGQIGAFEAVFSPRGSDGKPVPLFDRATGKVDATVARAWEKYDIRLYLEKHWSELSTKLAGKVRLYAGEKDTFYLDGAARLLQDSVKSLNADVLVEVVPGMVHTIYRPGIAAMVKDISAREGIGAAADAVPAGSAGTGSETK